MSYNIVTGIGTRRPPERITVAATIIGKHLAENGVLFRSGGAKGMDIAFEEGVDLVNGDKEIWLPREGALIRGDKSKGGQHRHQDYRAFKFAKGLLKELKIAPRVDGLEEYHQRLLARNVFQITGAITYSLSEAVFSDHVIFAAEENDAGEVKGGTGYVVRLARHWDIPTYNLMDPNQAEGIIDIFGLDSHDLLPLLKPKYTTYTYE
jgi:hypothetical protein